MTGRRCPFSYSFAFNYMLLLSAENKKRRDNLLNIKNIRNFAAHYVRFGDISDRFEELKG